MDEHELAQWVMANCDPDTRWRLTSKGGYQVIIVMHGYRSTHKKSFPYDLEFSHFYVIDADGNERESLPHGKEPLPDWFKRELESVSSHVPYHMNCDAFKRLVDEGRLVACGDER